MPDFDSLTTDELSQIVEFADGSRADPPARVGVEHITPSLVSRAFRELMSLGVLGFRADAHYDGCAC